MTFTQVQTKMNQAITTNASGDYAVRTIIEGDQTVTNLTVTGTLTAAEIDGDVAPQNSGSAGSVAVISDVQSSILYNRLGGKIFDKNVLLRDGDEVTGTVYVGADNIGDGQVCLIIADVLTLTGTVNFPQVTTGANFQTTNQISTVGRKFILQTSLANSTAFLGTVRAFTSGSYTMTASIFNLTSLGTLTADHVTMMNNMALVNGWTLAGSGTGGAVTVADTWALIGTWLNSATERAKFFAIAIPSHVSSMEGAIVEKVVNHGGNLAYLSDFSLSSPNNIGIISNDNTIISRNTTAESYSYKGIEYTLPAGVYIFDCDVTVTAGLKRLVIKDEVNVVLYADNTTVVNTIFTLTETQTLTFKLYSSIASSEVGDVVYANIQLNAGSTASTYSEPLYSPFEMGQKSDQLLKDGAGEMGASRWTGAVLTGTDLIVSASATPAVTPFTARQSGIHTFAVKNTTADAATVTGDLNSITSSAVAGSATPPWSVSTVELVAGTTYDFTVTASVNTTKIQAMIIFGEYTQAQIESRGYEDYDGIDLLTCPNNAGTSTVSDTLEQDAQGRIMFTDYVQRNAGYTKHGDPELSTAELMPNQVDRDFSGASAWADVDLASGGGAYDETGDLTITAGAVGDYCTCPVLSMPTTAGLKYRLYFDVANLVETWTLKNFAGTQTLGTVSADGTGQYVDFVALATGGLRIVSVAATSSADFDNFSLVAYNLQENLAPGPVDYTPYVIKGNLNQLAEVGQNHQVSSDGLSVYTTHYYGLGAALTNLKTAQASFLPRSEYNPEYKVNVVLPILASGGETVYLFSEFNAVDPSFPLYIPDATLLKETYGDADLTAVVYSTALIVMASGDSADDTECDFIIGSAKPSVTVDKSA